MKTNKTPPTKKPYDPKDFFALKREIFFLKLLVFVLVIACLASAGLALKIQSEAQLGTPASQPFVQKTAPYSDQVESTIERLRYSGYYNLMRDEARLRFNFEEGTWTIKNFRQFDPAGQTILEKNRYGACGDLAAYAYEQIKSLFPADKYSIDFLKVSESSYFQKEMSGNHYILRIKDLAAGKINNNFKVVYLLDPALRRYGTPDLFGEYLFLENISPERFFEVKDVDETAQVETGPPIIINRNAYIFLYVGSIEGKFDADNFSISLSVVRRYRYTRKPIFSIARTNGQTHVQKYDYPIHKVMSPKTFDKLVKRLMWLYLELQANGLDTPPTAAPPAAAQ